MKRTLEGGPFHGRVIDVAKGSVATRIEAHVYAAKPVDMDTHNPHLSIFTWIWIGEFQTPKYSVNDFIIEQTKLAAHTEDIGELELAVFINILFENSESARKGIRFQHHVRKGNKYATTTSIGEMG